MGDKLNSFCINISTNGKTLAYSIYPTSADNGKLSLREPIVSQSDLTANGGFSAIKSKLTDMFINNLSDLPSVYEQKHKYKLSTRLQDNMTGALKSAQNLTASAVDNTVGRLVKRQEPNQFFGNSRAEGDKMLEDLKNAENLKAINQDLAASRNLNAPVAIFTPNPNIGTGGTRRKRIKKSRKSRKHSNNIAI